MYDGKKLGLDVRQIQNGEQICICPFHADTNPSAFFNMTSGAFYCFACSEGFKYDTLLKKLGIEATDKLQSDYIFFERLGYEKIVKTSLSKEAKKYLTDERDIHLDEAQRYGFFQSDNYIGLPLSGGKYILRKYKGSGKRYIRNLPADIIAPMIIIKSDKPFLFVESFFSAIRIKRHLTDCNVYATLGTRVPKNLLSIASSEPHLFLFDKDNAGKKAAKNLISLGYNAKVSSIVLDEDCLNGIDRVIMNEFKKYKVCNLKIV